VFLCAGGNFKEVEKRLGISYPTVKNRLAEITDQLCSQDSNDQQDILSEVASGKMSVTTAIRQLNRRR